MLGSGRTVGLFVIGGGVLFACTGMVFTALTVRVSSNMASSWMVAGFILSLIIPYPIIRFGVRRFNRGQKILQELSTIKKQKKLLIMVKDQGQVNIHDAARALRVDSNEVKRLVYDLVGKQLFHGYINWDNSVLYSKHAVLLQGATHCPSCGAEQHFSGRGILQCHHCKAQVFL
jgi:hypothetical protein